MTDPFDRLIPGAESLGVSLDAGQVELLRRHFALVLDANRRMNLTRVTDPREAVEKLYLSSLAVFPALAEHGVVAEGIFRYLDLGTGAGFPGVPVAVAAPWMRSTLIDGKGKKMGFLAGALEALGLSARVRARHARGEEWARREPSGYELVTARAVAAAGRVVRECRDLLVPGGYLVVHKGPGLTDEEIAEGEVAAGECGLVLRGVAESAVGDLSPRLMVYSRWSAGDEGETPS